MKFFNYSNNMFHCRYGQQVDFFSDYADIQQQQHIIELFIPSVIKKRRVVEVVIILI